jgi:hypothetical protein
LLAQLVAPSKKGFEPVKVQKIGLLTDCTGGCTAVVGAPGELTITPFITPVPGPVVGAGLPGLLATGFGFIGLRRWRRWWQQRFA